VYSFKVLLALIHPLMPFVTEQLWAAMPAAAGSGRQLLITASWPAHSGAIDEAAIAKYQVGGLMHEAANKLQTELLTTCEVASLPYCEKPLPQPCKKEEGVVLKGARPSMRHMPQG
jgi:valyl-tRNA synthetase